MMFTAGVRYPAHLLHLVVATLQSIQTLMPPQPQLRQSMIGGEQSGSTALQEQALKAAAMGAGGALRTEPVSPIDRKSLTKALRSDVQLLYALRILLWLMWLHCHRVA